MENTQDLGYGWLYVITHPNGRGLIKIGITDRPAARMNDLGNPEILARIPVKNPRKHEIDLHGLYQSQRLPQSEWFNLSESELDDLLSNVASMADTFLSMVVLPPSALEVERENISDELAKARMEIEALRQKCERSQNDTSSLRAYTQSLMSLRDSYKSEAEKAAMERDHHRRINAELRKSLYKSSALLLGPCLQGTNLTGSKLVGVDLRGANLRESILQDVNFHRADLRCADLEASDLTGANLQAANVSGADLRGTILYDTELLHLIWDEGTKWPASSSFAGALHIPLRLREQLRIK